MVKIEDLQGSHILEQISNEILTESLNVPILKETFDRFHEASQNNDYGQNLVEVSDFILRDPFFSFKMMELSAKRKHSMHEGLEADINCLQKTLLLFGLDAVFKVALESCVCFPDKDMDRVIKKAQYDAQISKKIAILRFDILPDEVALANLMADLGELLLCIFRPNFPKMVRIATDEGIYPSQEVAQLELCGFKFKDLSLAIAHKVGFPPPIIKLMDRYGMQDIRHEVAESCRKIAEMVFSENGYLELPDEILDLKKNLGMINNKELFEILQLNRYLEHDNANYVLEKITSLENPLSEEEIPF